MSAPRWACANPQGGTLNIAIPHLRHALAGAEAAGVHGGHITINLATRPEQFDFATEPVDAAIHFRPVAGAELDSMSEQVVPACSRRCAGSSIPGAGGPAEAPLLHLESRPDAWERWFHAMGVRPRA